MSQPRSRVRASTGGGLESRDRRKTRDRERRDTPGPPNGRIRRMSLTTGWSNSQITANTLRVLRHLADYMTSHPGQAPGAADLAADLGIEVHQVSHAFDSLRERGLVQLAESLAPEATAAFLQPSGVEAAEAGRARRESTNTRRAACRAALPRLDGPRRRLLRPVRHGVPARPTRLVLRREVHRGRCASICGHPQGQRPDAVGRLRTGGLPPHQDHRGRSGLPGALQRRHRRLVGSSVG